MRKVSAFVPAHISGFFQVCDESPEFERKGSRNCGPCLDLGVLTEVRVERAGRTSVSVSIDGERSPHAKTTLSVIEQLLRAARGPFKVEVDHSCQVPVGAGYGASGAGALGAALAISEVLGLRLPRWKLVATAHVAEVNCRTGLGDVGAQSLGCLVIGLEPGAPPYGKWKHIPIPNDLKVICGTLAPLRTRELLRDEQLRDRSKKFGEEALGKLLKQPTLGNFMQVSQEFAEGLGLLDDELRALIDAARAAGAIGAGQVMLGKAVFAFARAGKAEDVRMAFLELIEPDEVMVAGIDQIGARLC